MSPLCCSRKLSPRLLSPGALPIAQPPHPDAVTSLVMAASYFSLAPFPAVGLDSQSSSSTGAPLTAASAALMWQVTTAFRYLENALATPSSHLPVAASGGTEPVSSGSVVVVVVGGMVTAVTLASDHAPRPNVPATRRWSLGSKRRSKTGALGSPVPSWTQ